MHISRRLLALSLSCLLLPAPSVQAFVPAPRATAPDTSGCPYKETVAPPIGTEEMLPPGATTPAPLPVGPNSLGTCGTIAAAGMKVPEAQTASAWIVVDIDNGDIFGAKDPHGRYRPASIIKVIVALLAIEHLDLDKEVVVSAESAAQEGSAVGIVPGGRYTIEQLLYGLLLQSGNDAAHALAQALGGDDITLKMANDLAQSLGTTDTRVTSYSGLDAAGLSTSAYDMALLYSHAFQNPTFAKMLTVDHVDFPGQGNQPGWQVWSNNGLLLNDPAALGGKTGYTDEAKHTFVGAKTINGRRLLAVVLDTTVDKGRAWQQAQRLLDAAGDAKEAIGVLKPEIPIKETSTTTTTSADIAISTAPADSSSPSLNRGNTNPAPYVAGGLVLLVLVAMLTWWLGGRRKKSTSAK
ncbi:D-alanyl-D-alanine carboxypeptidase family protein [Corynebacterium sp. HS2168-gen11]|uniref:D-alanyl-D-alanine carboxypeptidase family protein n=1 Tax=Corynebacterium sp. HS2168-gen11 TaxID=2974027 RepID=UPI00216B2212|nr:D-alanyl-D-alanine carboxypeptidase family protein [Corynebacterium sp. HS2168-gen11]MCS4535881.1 D-alanyl-D-alanine carboxypeptidase [Corynebacterium sp. HS2168-gen11]